MTPLAQIDLATLASKVSIRGLPKTGSLAFFVNAAKGPVEGAVRYIPGPTAPPTLPPAGLHPLENGFGGGPTRRGEPHEAQLLYPRMAIEMLGLTGAEMGDDDMLQARMVDLFGPSRACFLGISSFQAHFPAAGKPINRDCVARFAYGAEQSLANGPEARDKLEKRAADFRGGMVSLEQQVQDLKAKVQADIADAAAGVSLQDRQSQLDSRKADVDGMDHALANFDAECAGLQASISAMNSWATSGGRWAILTAAEQAEIAPLLAQWTNRSSLGYAHLESNWTVHRSVQKAADETFRVMAVAPDRVFAALPKPVQAAIDGPYRLPTDHLRHPMFGSPSSIQSAAEKYSAHTLLLQIQTDDLQGFGWGDMGVLQFWIRPKDLAAGNWSAVKVSCESH